MHIGKPEPTAVHVQLSAPYSHALLAWFVSIQRGARSVRKKVRSKRKERSWRNGRNARIEAVVACVALDGNHALGDN